MYKKIKRLFDLIVSIIALPFFFLTFIFVGPAIIVDDGFPIFFNAERIGKGGKFFKMYKYRSMKNQAPDIRLSDGSTYNSEDDPRLTKVGKILRKTSIDEIPQILNIIKGDMSLIGPRPDPPDWLNRYPEDMKDFLKVRPGITGYNQAYYRNSASSEEKMKNDVYYAMHCTFVMDVKILFKTIVTIFDHKNLYRDSTKDFQYLNDENIKKLKEFGYKYDMISNKKLLNKLKQARRK